MHCVGGIPCFPATEVEVLDFEASRDLYKEDDDFKGIREECMRNGAVNDYFIHDGCLFKSNCTCVPNRSLRLAIIKEAHIRSIREHFGGDKTYHVVRGNFLRPKLRRDVEGWPQRCNPRQRAKMHIPNNRIYTPLPIPNSSWMDVSADSVTSYLGTQRGKKILSFYVFASISIGSQARKW